MTLRLSTDQVLPQQRVDYWVSMVCDCLIPATPTFDDHGAVFGTIEVRPLGGLMACHFASSRQTFRRTERNLRQDPNDDIVALYLKAGSFDMRQGGRDVRLSAGDIALYDAARPFEHDISPESMLLVRMRRAQLLSRFPGAESLMAVRLDGQRSIGRVLATMMEEAYEAGGTDNSAVASHLSLAFLDTLAACLAATGEANALGDGSRYESLYRKALDVIGTRFDDPDLDGETLADALHVSHRTLARVCQKHGITPTQLIWKCRLEASRSVIESQRTRSVSDAAYQCGFSNISHFYRMFKRAYGTTPGDVFRSVAR